MEFHTIALQDKEWVEELLQYSGYNSCEYCFTNLYNWGQANRTKIARMGDYGVARIGCKEFYYLYPFGKGDVRPVIEAMIKDAEEHHVSFRISLLLDPMKQELETLFPQRFLFMEQRDYYDYIYTRKQLVELKGKKLGSKRHHLNRFLDLNPGWTFEKITRDNIEECWQMNTEWGAPRDDLSIGSGLLKEHAVLKSAFENFFAEDMVGG